MAECDTVSYFYDFTTNETLYFVDGKLLAAIEPAAPQPEDGAR